MEGIKLLKIRISDDGDFYWNLESFKREDNIALIYLENPTTNDLKEVLNQVADEFEKSFEADKDWLEEVKNVIVHELKRDYRLERLLVSGGYNNDFGNYSLDVELIDYVQKEVKIYNTNEVKTIGTFFGYYEY